MLVSIFFCKTIYKESLTKRILFFTFTTLLLGNAEIVNIQTKVTLKLIWEIETEYGNRNLGLKIIYGPAVNKKK